jgi:hypothetical protein
MYGSKRVGGPKAPSLPSGSGMANNERPTAFIAMRFDSDHWRDKTYLVIREVLESAGYLVLRADELKTSGPVVDEVCRLLGEAELVVVDSSGHSHNVSYELGYCHGIGRSPERTLLLSTDEDLPFNYRHYRHRVYKDIRHLRRLLRDYLSISEPLKDDMLGYAFTFEFSKEAMVDYIMDGAECVLDALLATGISCRCEIYSAEQFLLGERLFTIGAAVRLLRPMGRPQVPTYEFWRGIVDEVKQRTEKFPGRIALDTNMSELAMKRSFKAHLLYGGATEVREGEIVRVLDSGEEGNFIEWYLERRAGIERHPKQVPRARPSLGRGGRNMQ